MSAPRALLRSSDLRQNTCVRSIGMVLVLCNLVALLSVRPAPASTSPTSRPRPPIGPKNSPVTADTRARPTPTAAPLPGKPLSCQIQGSGSFAPIACDGVSGIVVTLDRASAFTDVTVRQPAERLVTAPQRLVFGGGDEARVRIPSTPAAGRLGGLAFVVVRTGKSCCDVYQARS